MTIGEQIRYVRKHVGLTQKELGDLSGTSETTIKQYELGKRQPRIEQLKKIAYALGGTIYEIFILDNDLFDASTSADAEYEEKLIDEKMKSIITNNNYSEKKKKVLLQDLISQIEITANMHKENAECASKYIINQLLNQLNLEGQKKAIEQIEMLTKIKEYQVEGVIGTLSKSPKSGHTRIGNKDNSSDTVAAHNPETPEESPENSDGSNGTDN